MEPYIVMGGTLRVLQSALTQDDHRFDQACRKLLGAVEPTLTVDLSAVRLITSTYVGVLAVTFLDARKTGRQFVIRAPRRVLDVFRLAGFKEGEVRLEETAG